MSRINLEKRRETIAKQYAEQMKDWLDFIWSIKDTDEFRDKCASSKYRRFLYRSWSSRHNCVRVRKEQALIEMQYFMDYIHGLDSFSGAEEAEFAGVELIG